MVRKVLCPNIISYTTNMAYDDLFDQLNRSKRQELDFFSMQDFEMRLLYPELLYPGMRFLYPGFVRQPNHGEKISRKFRFSVIEDPMAIADKKEI